MSVIHSARLSEETQGTLVLLLWRTSVPTHPAEVHDFFRTIVFPKSLGRIEFANVVLLTKLMMPYIFCKSVLMSITKDGRFLITIMFYLV